MSGVVLDFDGVIVRSMEMHAEAYRRVLQPFGVDFPDRQIFEREGATSETIIEDLLRGNGENADKATVQRLADEKQRAFLDLGPPRLYPGAEEMVHRIRRAATRLGLVTGTRRENLAKFVPTLLPLFDAVLAAKDYSHDKPHPEPYERAAQAIGVEPRNCAAVENATRGVQSAKAAGFPYVVAIPTTMGRDELRAAGADDIVASHGEAAERIVAWLGDER